MADQLFLSYWIRGFSGQNMLRHFEKMLERFPFSTQPQGRSLVEVRAISFAEPPVMEQVLEAPLDRGGALQLLREFPGYDCAFKLESWWDLWQHDSAWRLRPARVSLYCFGPEFERDLGEAPRPHPAAPNQSRNSGVLPPDASPFCASSREDLRIEFGVDSHFLPQEDIEGSAPKIRSNLKGLLRLTHELDDALAVDNRKLWTESGENFADRLKSLIE